MSPRLSRRDWLNLSSAGVVGWSLSGWLGALADEAAQNPRRKRSCILLWMNGGPSTIDLWDLKPGHKNGGPFKEIDTSVPGIKIGENLPKMAKHMDRMALIRSMSTKEADHGRATYYMRTGHVPGGPIQYPALGALVAKELARLVKYVESGGSAEGNPASEEERDKRYNQALADVYWAILNSGEFYLNH